MKLYGNVLNFESSVAELSLFFPRDQQACVLLLVYVNDAIITDDNSELINPQLRLEFFLKDIGGFSYFLGLQFTGKMGAFT